MIESPKGLECSKRIEFGDKSIEVNIKLILMQRLVTSKVIELKSWGDAIKFGG